MEKERVQVVNVDDIDIDALDKKFEMLSAEGAKEMAKNFGAPNLQDYEGK
jgi:hypothetical protein